MLPVVTQQDPGHHLRSRSTLSPLQQLQQQRSGAGSFQVAASQAAAAVCPPSLGFEECRSVHDLLIFFSSAHLPSSIVHDLTSEEQKATAQLATSRGVFVRGHSDASLRPPSSWNSSERREVRQAVVRHLTDLLVRSPKRSGTGSSAPSMESFFLFLVAGEHDVLNGVRQRGQAKFASEVSSPPTAAAAAASERLQDAHRTQASGRRSAMEREAFALLTRCAACLSLRGQQSPSQAMGPSRQGDTTHSGGSLSTLHGCSTFSLLRTSAGPLSLIGPAAPYWCSTGCVGLDRALGGGGFRSGWVTEVYGEAGAGKTQLGLQCLLQQSAHDLCKSAAALCLAHNPQFAALRLLQQQQQQNTQSTQGTVQRCSEAFHVESVKAARCAVVYLVSEEVPTSRLGPLAAAAVRRAVRAVQLHPLITSLPSGIVEAVMRSVRQTCTDTMVLSCLQIRHIASMQELLRLVEPHAAAAPPPSSPGEGRSSCSLSDAVRMLSGSLGRALIVLDSIAAAVVAGQADIHGIAQTDASVAAIATQLRCAAARHNWCVVGINQVRATRHHSTGSSCTQFKRTRSPTSSSSLSSSGFSADGSHTVVPALGLAWSSASQCRVHLRKSLSLGVRQLILRQSPAHPPSQASYVITQNGIEDA